NIIMRKKIASVLGSKWTQLATCTAVAAANVTTLLADNTIWDTAESASNNLMTKLQDFYCKGIFYPILLLSIILWAVFAKNEKTRNVFATAIKVECAAFILLLLPNTFTATLDQIAGWLNGAST
nr:hypothetical protein [Treponema sp.]